VVVAVVVTVAMAVEADSKARGTHRATGGREADMIAIAGIRIGIGLCRTITEGRAGLEGGMEVGVEAKGEVEGVGMKGGVGEEGEMAEGMLVSPFLSLVSLV
jgi:hypothetical protein